MDAQKSSNKLTKAFARTLKKLASSFRSAGKVLFSNKKAIAGFLILSVFLFIAVFGRLIFSYSEQTDALNKFQAPSKDHWLGLDEQGRDLFGQLIYGMRDFLLIALLTSVFAVLAGVLLGMVSGLTGGVVDKVIMMITNLFLSIPSFPMMLMLSAFLQIDDSFSFALVLAMFNWAGLCRAIRSQVISIKERDFILICKVMNLSKAHIIFKELVPNIASYILVNFILIMRNATMGSVGIMMLGLASFDPSNLGAILYRAKAVILTPEATLLWLSPIVTLALFQAGSLLLANGLDETLNPRLKEK